jgi:hypothetical protein
MRQLDWWETILPGDLAWFPGSPAPRVGYCSVRITIGMTVDEAFWHYKAGGQFVIFYRPVENQA